MYKVAYISSRIIFAISLCLLCSLNIADNSDILQVILIYASILLILITSVFVMKGTSNE